jgi:tRNA nucleotidyltransferase/poly(A) polymerase
MNLISGEILDLTGKGKEDIEKGIIQSPTEPDRIFMDDPLRLLRAIRFAGRYGYKIPDFMKKSIIKNAPELKNISRERIKEELEKILTGKNNVIGLSHLFDLGLIHEFLPEIEKDKNQILSSFKQQTTDFLGMMSLLFQGLSGNIAEKICQNLKLSTDETKTIVSIVDSVGAIKSNNTSETVLKSGSDLFSKGLDRYINLLPLSEKDKDLIPLFASGPRIYFSPNDLKTVFGLKPGPIFSKLIQFQKNLWYKNPEISKEEVSEKIQKALQA